MANERKKSLVSQATNIEPGFYTQFHFSSFSIGHIFIYLMLFSNFEYYVFENVQMVSGWINK